MKEGPCRKTAFLGPSERTGPEGVDKSPEICEDAGSPGAIYVPWK